MKIQSFRSSHLSHARHNLLSFLSPRSSTPSSSRPSHSRQGHSSQWIRSLIVPAAMAMALLLIVGPSVYADDVVNTDRTGLAIGGYDPVAYFTMGQPVKGDFQITLEYRGATYWFINEGHRDLFAQNPTHYLPQYGGYCAYGVAANQKFSGDPTVWKIINERLYLNLHGKIADIFNEDSAGYVAKADENWKTLADQSAQ